MSFHRSMLPWPLRVMHDHIRLFSSAAFGLVLLVLLPRDLRASTRLLVAWDFGIVAYLMMVFFVVRAFDRKRVQIRAAEEDEGRFIILILVVAAAAASLGAIVVELGAVRASPQHDGLDILLVAATILLSWALIHVIFALHYAHEFYRHPGNGRSCLVFPGDEPPDYWDFVYFSFVIGMTFQVSDVQVAAKDMRRIVVAHGVVSFVFDVAIIALVVNLGANLI